MSAIPRSATARLRKTFQYPTDDSSFSDTPEILDEDEQESLIQTLAEQNEARNRQFRLVMLALPALSALPCLVLLPAAPPLPTLLSLSSLASTAWLLYRQDPTETGIPRLDAWAAARHHQHHPATTDDYDNDDDDDDDGPSTPLSPAARRRHRERRSRRNSSFSLPAGARLQQRSPLETHLPLLNAGLCVVLLLTGLAIARGGGGGGGSGRDGNGNDDDGAARLGRAALACLPAIVYAVVVAAKLVMASVDPEAELGALRYEAKGA
ncbi:hypothetical protein GGTG_06781 [Gaeumannomyces tritici R3-111a-1]|uniref:Uncharacterized protein n=1 Tax=Gaeumannomyces tritici (strain R3-111a-1) TaxID=644352 RepID=J3NZT4_GAET3|nr:hypothetical protein GGTG_06781 [Gaeumannomyces tritici R3-111a-1]EJT76867.1 hypothetical protein GGTG_06781 [Gaeumannomyces tritici R3-111a-1]